MKYLIKNGLVVNENIIEKKDILISNNIIEKFDAESIPEEIIARIDTKKISQNFK